MGFPDSVADEAMVLCGRCCCICHKFCGTKIELHHIKQKVFDGEDTLDNCIPLCFDCHSDMGKADPKHPKGKHYSEAELRRHRDSWFRKVADVPLQYQVENDYTADKELFKSICGIFSEDVRYWLSLADIGGSHPYHTFDSFSKLLYLCGDPFFEFINTELEKLKGNLFYNINEFMSYKATNTFVRDVSGKDHCVTRQWMVNNGDLTPRNMSYEEYSELYATQARTLNDLATTVWNEYCEFVRQGRQLLNL